MSSLGPETVGTISRDVLRLEFFTKAGVTITVAEPNAYPRASCKGIKNLSKCAERLCTCAGLSVPGNVLEPDISDKESAGVNAARVTEGFSDPNELRWLVVTTLYPRWT